MAIKEANEVFKSFDYKQIYNITLDENQLYILSELTNPNKNERLFGVIRATQSQKEPDSKARPNVLISYYENKLNNKFTLIRNQLSLAIIYMYIKNSAKKSDRIYEIKLNPLLIAELEYSISHDILRKMQEIKNLNEELKEEDISESYINECKETEQELISQINIYNEILSNVIDKTVGKDGIHLIQVDMNKNETEGLNSLKLHMEMCRKGLVKDNNDEL